MFDKTIKDVVIDSGIKGIVYAGSGYGKTFSISTLPDLHRVCVVNAEAGMRTLEEICPDVACETVNDLPGLRDVYLFLKDTDRFDTVVIDSLTEVGEQVLSKVMAESSDDPRKIYPKMSEKVMGLVKSFRDLPGKNVLLICQQAKVQDDSGRIYYGPSMPGKQVGGKLPYQVDFVAALRVRPADDGEGVKRALQFEPDEQYEAKQRGGKLNAFEPVNWAHIFQKIKGGHNG